MHLVTTDPARRKHFRLSAADSGRATIEVQGIPDGCLAVILDGLRCSAD
jgi:hypothetical protein